MLLTICFLSDIGYSGIFGNILGKKKDNSGNEQVEDKLIEEDFEAPSVDILGKSYPVNNIDLPAETIYENHSREELIALLGEIINLSTLQRDEDTLDDSYRKYFAAIIATAYFLEGYSGAVTTSISRITAGHGDKHVKMIYKFRGSETGRLVKLSREVLYTYIPGNFVKLIFEYSSAMGYRLFIEDFSKQSRKYFHSTRIANDDYNKLLQELDRFLLAQLVSILYTHWNFLNQKILNEMPKAPDWDFVPRWKVTHQVYLNHPEIKRNRLLDAFMKEAYRFSDF